MPALPRPGASILPPEADRLGAALAYRRFGDLWLRVDLAEKLIRAAHSARGAARVRRFALRPDLQLSKCLTIVS